MMNEARVYLVILFLVFFILTPILVRISHEEKKS